MEKTKIFSNIITGMLIILGGIFVYANVVEKYLLSVFSILGTVIVFIIMFFWLKKIVREEKEQNSSQDNKHEGLFGEIWNDIDKIVQIDGVKIEHLDKSGNVIDTVIYRNEHEFGIVIDEECLGIIVDEEDSDNPLEIEVRLSQIKDIEDFRKILIEIIMNYS